MKNEYLRWMADVTPWWHDSAKQGEAASAFENGCVGMTTNPFLMAAALTAEKDTWTEVLKNVDRSLTGDAKALDLERVVAQHYTAQLTGIWDGGKDPRKGGVCAQVSPCNIGNAKLLTEQMNTIASFAPNVFVKLPATWSGMVAFEEGIANGYNVVSTVSFSVPQVIAAAEAQKRGEARAKAAGKKPGNGVAVVMLGRLDDYIRDAAMESGLNITDEEVSMSGVAVMKKAYQIYQQRGYKTVLMPAGGRMPHHVTELAGAKGMAMTISARVQQMLAEKNPAHESRIDVPVDKAVMDKLLALPEFVKAYNEDGMTEKEFIAYGAVNRTATMFAESGWNILLNYKID